LQGGKVFVRLKQRTVALQRLYSYDATRQARHPATAGLLGGGATVTNRYERLKMQRRMQRRIRLVVEERRMAVAQRGEPGPDPDATIEIPHRAVGRAIVDGA
jgi:hypothetical protein